MDVVRISVLAVVAVLLALLLKSYKPEYGFYIAITAGVSIFLYVVVKLEFILESIQKMETYFNLQETHLFLLLKMIGITYVAEFTSNLCKDAGFSALASQIELFAKLSILALSFPILLTLMDLLRELL